MKGDKGIVMMFWDWDGGVNGRSCWGVAVVVVVVGGGGRGIARGVLYALQEGYKVGELVRRVGWAEKVFDLYKRG